MKCQDLFSMKNINDSKNECRLLQMLLGAVSVNCKGSSFCLSKVVGKFYLYFANVSLIAFILDTGVSVCLSMTRHLCLK